MKTSLLIVAGILLSGLLLEPLAEKALSPQEKGAQQLPGAPIELPARLRLIRVPPDVQILYQQLLTLKADDKPILRRYFQTVNGSVPAIGKSPRRTTARQSRNQRVSGPLSVVSSARWASPRRSHSRNRKGLGHSFANVPVE